jgi:hypothetical protein
MSATGFAPGSDDQSAAPSLYEWPAVLITDTTGRAVRGDRAGEIVLCDLETWRRWGAEPK